MLNDNRVAFKPAAGEIPTSAGVYRFSDHRGKVLYIGKAKNLRLRLANYFAPLDTLAPRTRKMLSMAARLDWTVVATDTEALLLEQQWISAQKPPYNVVWRDDKSFPYLAVTLKSEAPRLIITRNEKIKGAQYFGPYPKVWALKETLELLNKAFQIRTCNDADYNRAIRDNKACLAGQIGRCHGPCSQKVTFHEHNERVTELVQFLQHMNDKRVKVLRREMLAAAQAQEFEKAARLRDQMQAIENILERNAIVLPFDTNADFFGLYHDDLNASVHQFIVRGGRIVAERSWLVDIELDETPETLFTTVLHAAYSTESAPTQIYLSHTLTDTVEVQEMLSKTRPRAGKVLLQQPERGDKAQLMQTAVRNAAERLMRHKLKRAADLTSRTDALAQLQQALGMQEAPLRIECIDVSHLGGTNVVASLVVFEDALPVKNEYRKYSIDKTSDDTESIYQVVTRRAAHLQKLLAAAKADNAATIANGVSHNTGATVENGDETHTKNTDKKTEQSEVIPASVYRQWPQLLIVDGGKPQVNAAARALQEAQINNIFLVGIAKRLEELWIADEEFPIILPRTSEALFLVQRLRDEAHRFAITYQRQKRAKAIASQLAAIPGLGPARVKSLLRTFGSARRVRQASLEELAAVPGISKNLAQNIKNALDLDPNKKGL